jgi:hypothetical protein
MKKLLIMLVVLGFGMAAQAVKTAEWTFEGNLNDSATGGSVSDTLVGMRYYPGNGKFDGSVTNYKTDGTTEVLTTAVTTPKYEAGVVGQAVRIGARGVYNYTGTNVYPDASTYQVPGINDGATYLSTTADSADLTSNAFTMEGFFKADAVGTIGTVGALGEFVYTRLISKWVSGFNQSYHFTIHNGALELIEKNSSNSNVTKAASVSVSANRWFYVAAVGDGDEVLSLYFYTTNDSGDLIGGLLATATYDGTMKDSTDPLWIGARVDIPNPITNNTNGTNNGFIGLVDEVRYWNNAQDAAYIADRAQLLIPEPITLVILGLGGLLIRRK